MSLHTSLNIAHSGGKLSIFMSSFTHSFQVFLFLPLNLTPATSKFLQADTQSFPLLRYNLCCTFYPFYHSTHPSHHHPLRPLETLQIFSLHRPCFSPICQHTLDTSLVYLSLYAVWCPWAVGIGDNFLNLAQAHLTLALAASSTPPAPSVSPK